MIETGMTLRQKILDLLEKGPHSAREISQAAGVSEKDLPFHLEAIEKSLRHRNLKLVILPWHCLACGFEFSKRRKMSRPGKCPVCRQGRITAARFRIDKI